jgi:uncharacterized membrane protein YeaQ/YmgE (transglycosylase-associated protein family)
MSLLVYLIVLAIQGLIFGALARLALPGRDPMSVPMTMLVGIAGSFIGGLVTYLITGGRSGGGLFVAFVATVLLVYLIRRSRGGGVMSPDEAQSELRRRRGY